MNPMSIKVFSESLMNPQNHIWNIFFTRGIIPSQLKIAALSLCFNFVIVCCLIIAIIAINLLLGEFSLANWKLQMSALYKICDHTLFDNRNKPLTRGIFPRQFATVSPCMKFVIVFCLIITKPFMYYVFFPDFKKKIHINSLALPRNIQYFKWGQIRF